MMDIEKSKRQTGSIIKKLMFSLSFPKRRAKSPVAFLPKSKSWNSSNKTRKKFVAPNGCFSVYVGSEKQRFVIEAKSANHPLFMKLLEDAELEYGYNSEGPILLPCDVDLFYRVIAEMEKGDEDLIHPNLGCGALVIPFSPARRLGNSSSMSMAKGYSPYALLTPPRAIN